MRKENSIDLFEGHSFLTPYTLDGVRPTILVIPGGGYVNVCERTEGEAIARRFNELGFHAFVLEYRVAPHRFPEPQQDAMRALRLIRYRAAEWGVITDRIAVCGFSAGGHLAGCMGTITAHVPSVFQDEIDAMRGDADAMILSYAVLSFAPWSHAGTRINLCGDDAALTALCNLPDQVGAHTPPAFIWHTFEDSAVPYQNAIDFAVAMRRADRPCELHIFPHGDHGTLLGLDTPDISKWQELAASFILTQWDIRDSGRDNILCEKYGYTRQSELQIKYGYKSE